MTNEHFFFFERDLGFGKILKPEMGVIKLGNSSLRQEEYGVMLAVIADFMYSTQTA